MTPIDLLLAPDRKALVVTGPNTGGKTVALKTAGLLALMAQAGLRIPAADGSRLPVFRSLFADIGDERTSSAIFTFGPHRQPARTPAAPVDAPLVLLDEPGGGTYPEGARRWRSDCRAFAARAGWRSPPTMPSLFALEP